VQWRVREQAQREAPSRHGQRKSRSVAQQDARALTRSRLGGHATLANVSRITRERLWSSTASLASKSYHCGVAFAQRHGPNKKGLERQPARARITVPAPHRGTPATIAGERLSHQMPPKSKGHDVLARKRGVPSSISIWSLRMSYASQRFHRVTPP
jgi:hypothetical protein